MTNIDQHTECSILEQRKQGVYCIINLVNNKFYIGSATQKSGFRRRWQKHLLDLINNKHTNTHLQRAFNIDGKNNFKFYILETHDDYNTIINREQYWINNSNCLNPNIGYNKYPIAISINKDYIASKETRKKLSNKLKGIPRPEWMKIKYGKPISQHTLDGVLITTYPSTMEAYRITKIHRVGIKYCLQGKYKTAGGYVWKYIN